MRHLTPGLTLVGIAAFLLTACGGGGGGGSGSSSGSSSGGSNNAPPVANAGLAQSVAAGVVVTLNGAGSTDSDGSVATYSWTQTGGSTVTLSSTTVAQPTFTAPLPAAVTTLTFSLVVTDNRGAQSNASSVTITVSAAPTNIPPISAPGMGQSVNSGTLVRIDGSASTDPDGSIVAYAWTQVAGPAVTLSSTTESQATFTAPPVATATTLTFSLMVTDNGGATSANPTVNVIVNPVVAGNVMVAGKVRFERIGFRATTPFGLFYGSPILLPSRGVTVRALNASNPALQLAIGSTDSKGDYSLSLPANTNILIEVVARMRSPTGQALPNWDIRVQDGLGTAPSPYAYRTASFGSGAGVTRDVDLPAGVDASGVATGTRVSAPFAILDTLYTAMQAVLGVAPAAEFPALYVDWGSQSNGTFFTTANGQHIALLSDLTEDTDEFDQHVIAHEFGHYLEENFSRADSIGGPHSLGDRLDARVAFGEGFGYAFAAIVLDDPDVRDSFVDGTQQRAGRFNVETNPTGTSGCWCSESSVFAILYDIADGASDTNDSLSLGLQPIWDVLVNAQRSTPSFTTLFSFITALKAARPANAIAIDTLVSAQNINSLGMNAFATQESNAPVDVASNAVLPLYTAATGIPSAPIVLRNVDDAGHYNKLGNHRYIRMDATTTRDVTITATSSNPDNPDVDFVVYREGARVADGTDPPTQNPETESFTVTPGTYIIDVYDCANGCDTEQGTPGDYDLTVTITTP